MCSHVIQLKHVSFPYCNFNSQKHTLLGKFESREVLRFILLVFFNRHHNLVCIYCTLYLIVGLNFKRMCKLDNGLFFANFGVAGDPQLLKLCLISSLPN